MKLVRAAFAIVTFPLVLLNAVAGLAGAVCLIAVGLWDVPVVAVLVGLLASWTLAIALLPSARMAAAAFNIGRRRRWLSLPVAAAAGLWTYGVMTVWSVGVFEWFLATANGRQIVPMMLLAYGVAAAPWSRMAAEEAKADPTATPVIAAFFCQAGCAAMMWMSWTSNGAVPPQTLLAAFAPCMAATFLLQCLVLTGEALDTSHRRIVI